jgi:hypothetical protein
MNDLNKFFGVPQVQMKQDEVDITVSTPFVSVQEDVKGKWAPVVGFLCLAGLVLLVVHLVEG